VQVIDPAVVTASVITVITGSWVGRVAVPINVAGNRAAEHSSRISYFLLITVIAVITRSINDLFINTLNGNHWAEIR
jgi:hypothetical protein